MITNIWVKIGAFLAITAVLTVLAIRAYDWAYDNGVTDQKVIAETEKNNRLIATNKALIATQKQLAQLELDYAKLVTANSDNYQKGLKDGQLKKSNAIASVNAGTLKLQDNYAAARTDCITGSNVESDPSSGGRNATESTGLSRETSEFLISLANEADDVVKQLTTVQADYKALYEFCSTPR